MANDVTSNPWKLDTAASISAAVVQIGRIRWVGGATAGHTAIVKDSAGTVIASLVATASNYTEDVPIWKEYTGVTLDTLASGTLYLSIDKRPKRF